MFFDQSEFDIRCEWGEQGVSALAPISDAVIIVDVLSFTTCVEIAVSRGAVVYPYRWKDFSSQEFAAAHGAELTGSRRDAGKYSLSPASLIRIPPGTRLVMPSPNGATLSLGAGSTPVIAGCLRNARAAAQAALRFGPRVAVIPAGERWSPSGSLRPSLEDWLGAGAILQHLPGARSPEAEAAAAVFRQLAPRLEELLLQCSSGKELVERGYPEDVRLAAQLDISAAAPALVEGAFVA
jgi:2-phosphosulfolactate phosphatase